LAARSRPAPIEHPGAKLDGILRSRSRSLDDRLRDTCVYSIIASESPAVRRNLDWRLNRVSAATTATRPL
jgi:hypothetical protein